MPVTPVDPTLVVSRALTLYAGTVASGNNRYDADIIARWMFKEGSGSTAFDTSGVDPAINLTISGNTTWDSAWGLIFGTGGAKAQGSTATSSKIYSAISTTGQYSLELWAAPANVTQTMAFMGGYSGGTTARNFTLAQDAMQYQAYGRSTVTDANGAPPLTTAAANMNAQAALQHIVLTYDPTHGRQLYVNGNFTGDVDTLTGGTLGNWDNTFAFLLGNETSNDRPWQGEIRFAAVHNHALTMSQIQQNYAAGVGQLLLPAVRRQRADRRVAELHHVHGQPVRQLQLPVRQADLHQSESESAAGQHSDPGHVHRHQRPGSCRSARPTARSIPR